MIPGRWTVRHLVYGGRDLFGDWMSGLRDVLAVKAIVKRLDRLAHGNFGDSRSVGGGVWELKIRLGPGYRIYYAIEGPFVVLVMSGGEKSNQVGDVRRAQALWRQRRGGRK